MRFSSRGGASATPEAARRRGARVALPACAAALAALGFAAAPAAGGPPPPGPSSAIHDRIYAPSAITVAAGQTISWHNETLGPHTVTSTTELFNSGRLDAGASYSLKFANPGTFDYYCTVHPTMKGVVTVLAIPPEKVLLSVSSRRAKHGRASTVRAQVARSGETALLQAAPGGGRGFKTVARAQLGSEGTASFALGAGAARRVRVVVPAAYGQPQLLSRVVTLPA
jgi:plastocyanin